jgi:CMP-N,N'-diacetyllegionaminic acid synthase
MSLLCLIPARGGSKGIFRKNIKSLSGKPLIAWTIDAAKQSKYIDEVVVSTDDIEIAEIAKQYGAKVPFLRPNQLATDEALIIDVITHTLKQLPRFDWLLLLQPTSPLRTTSDIEGIIKFCKDNKSPSAASICEVSKHPYWMYQKDERFRLQPFIIGHPEITRRQELPKAYSLNGALYLAKIDWLLKQKSFIGKETLGFVMSLEKSADLDTIEDWNWAEYLIKKKYEK